MKLKIIDDHGIIWLWNGTWLDIDYSGEEEREPTSGYLATTFEEVCAHLVDGGYIEQGE